MRRTIRNPFPCRKLYAQRGRQDGRAVQDWEQAEREIRKDERHK